MSKIIAVVNQKGGVGKTTTSINLAASLGMLGKKVLLIDLDPQGNASTGVDINKNDFTKSIYELLTEDATVEEVVIKTKFKNLDLIPASINLAGIDIELLERTNKETTFEKASQLKKMIQPIVANYDYIIIDCPPSLGLLTTNALAAVNSVMIPVQCEFFALDGVIQLLNTINLAKKNLNPSLDIEGVVLTMFDNRTNLGIEVIEEIRGSFRDRTYDTLIPRAIKLAEAPSHGQPIIYYYPHGKSAQAYLSLAKEVISKNGN